MTASTGTTAPLCCGEPDCTRKHPVGIYLADISDRVYVVTRRRLVRENPDGTALFAAAGRHDVTLQMREFIRRNPDWVRAVLGEETQP